MQRKEVTPMEEIKKALQELAAVISSDELIDRIKVTITLVRPKASSKAKDKSGT